MITHCKQDIFFQMQSWLTIVNFTCQILGLKRWKVIGTVTLLQYIATVSLNRRNSHYDNYHLSSFPLSKRLKPYDKELLIESFPLVITSQGLNSQEIIMHSNITHCKGSELQTCRVGVILYYHLMKVDPRWKGSQLSRQGNIRWKMSLCNIVAKG